MTRRLAGTIALTIVLVAGLALAASPATAGAQQPTYPSGSEVPSGTPTQTLVSPAPSDPDQVVLVQEGEGEGDLTGGFLDWGVKSSFRSYIVGPIAQGTITLEGGASRNANGTFRFPLVVEPEPVGSFDPSTGAVEATFAGSVSFKGHCNHAGSVGECLLQLSVSDIRIETTPTGGNLIADVVSVPLEGDISNPGSGAEPVTYDDIVLATLDLSKVSPVAAEVDGHQGAAWLNVPTALGPDGGPIFEGFYNVGTPLDPVSFTLGLTEEVDLPEPPPTDEEEVGVVLDKSTVAVGGTLTASGEGFTAGEQVEVWVHSTPIWVGTAVADASGVVSYTFAVPSEVPPGVHQVELRGISSGLSLWSGDFTVTAAESTGGTGTTGTPTAGKGTLPNTGPGDLEGPLAAAGLALLLFGTVLLVSSRRMRRPGTTKPA